MIQKGEKAPDFSLEDAHGKLWSLRDFQGKRLILYFYPKDNTPGCTLEACAFRDSFAMFKELGWEVVGISPDKPESHRKFAEKFSLPFVLLADPEKKALTAYGAWGEKSMYGKKVQGVIRSTVLIGENGEVLEVFPKVSPATHPAELLKLLRANF